MIYIGAGRRTLKGQASRLRYYVSDHRRHFRVDPRDVEDILKHRDFMLEP